MRPLQSHPPASMHSSTSSTVTCSGCSQSWNRARNQGLPPSFDVAEIWIVLSPSNRQDRRWSPEASVPNDGLCSRCSDDLLSLVRLYRAASTLGNGWLTIDIVRPTSSSSHKPRSARSRRSQSIRNEMCRSAAPSLGHCARRALRPSRLRCPRLLCRAEQSSDCPRRSWHLEACIRRRSHRSAFSWNRRTVHPRCGEPSHVRRARHHAVIAQRWPASSESYGTPGHEQRPRFE